MRLALFVFSHIPSSTTVKPFEELNEKFMPLTKVHMLFLDTIILFPILLPHNETTSVASETGRN